jgi:hypothetical protein
MRRAQLREADQSHLLSAAHVHYTLPEANCIHKAANHSDIFPARTNIYSLLTYGASPAQVTLNAERTLLDPTLIIAVDRISIFRAAADSRTNTFKRRPESLSDDRGGCTFCRTWTTSAA